MNTAITESTLKRGGVALVTLLVVLGTVSGVAVAAGSTDIKVSAAENTLAPGETTEVTVAISDADGGVGSADLRVETSDPSVVTIQDVTVEANASFQEVRGDETGQNVNFAAAETETNTGEVVFLTVTVEAVADGTANIDVVDNPEDVVDGVAVGDEAANSYTIENIGSATVTVESPDSANFEVSNLDAPDSATQGDTINVSADVENTGGQAANQTVEFRVDVDGDGFDEDDDVVVPQEVQLDPGQSTTVEFTDINTSDLPADTFTHGVVTENDSATAQITITEPTEANFQVSNLDAPANATQGDAIDVSADVTNDGDEEATQSVEFRLDFDGDGTLDDDEVLTAQDVSLDGGETQTVTFENLDTSELLPGDYTHGVFTDDDSETATITINESDASAAETSVSLSPQSSEVVVGDTEAYDVVVDNADGGIGAYELTISLDDASAASITNATVAGTPGLTDVSYADDNSSVTIRAALMDTNDTGTVSIASITVSGTAEGSSDLSVDVQALGNEDGESYTVTDENGASVSVINLPPVGNFSESPTDPDGDGLYEDINGDGEFNIVDVQALFANLDDETVQNNVDEFDFNEDGKVDVVDVQKLFTEFTEVS